MSDQNPQQNKWPESNSVLILVDFSAIAFACWAAAERAMEAGVEALTSHRSVCGACGSAGPCVARDAIKQYDPHEVIKTNLRMKMGTIEENTGEEPNKYVMVLDSHAKWRYDTFPGYKGDREHKFNPRPEAEAYLRQAYPGMQWVVSYGNEADDAIATLVKSNKAQRAIVIVTGDKDLWTLLEPRVKIFNSVTKHFLDLDGVAKKFYGLEPKHIRLAKALWGDPSDSLPNCAPRQQKQLVPIIQEVGGDLTKMTNLQQRVSPACWKHLAANFQQVVTNWKVVGLKDDVDLEWL